jgi:hypothetical protein
VPLDPHPDVKVVNRAPGHGVSIQGLSAACRRGRRSDVVEPRGPVTMLR